MSGHDAGRLLPTWRTLRHNDLRDLAGQRVLVTGAAGFIGRSVVRALLAAEARVVALDDFSTGSREALPDAEGLAVVVGNVTDRELVRDLMRGAAVVVHLAARNIIASTRNPWDDYEVNVGGTLGILLAARDADVHRVVYSSSASVYGNPRYLPMNEDDPTDALSPYSVSKLAGENYCKSFYESYGLSTTALRYSNVYGPGQDSENPYSGVVAKLFAAAEAGQPPQIHGDGEQTRDFTYVDDVVEATLLATISAKADGQVYNVGTGRETTINRLAAIALELVGADIEPVHIDRRDIDNIRRRSLNIEKIRRELRWTPAMTLEEGLRAALTERSERAANTSR